MTCHNTLKPQNGLLFEFLKKLENLKAEACFIPNVTCSVLSVGALSVFLFALQCIFH